MAMRCHKLRLFSVKIFHDSKKVKLRFFNYDLQLFVAGAPA